MSWPGKRTAVTVERARELLAQHSRGPTWRWRHPLRSWAMRKWCVLCLEPRPCYQRRWAVEMLEEIGKQMTKGRCTHCGAVDAPVEDGYISRHRRADWRPDVSPSNEVCAGGGLRLRPGEPCRCGMPAHCASRAEEAPTPVRGGPTETRSSHW